MNAKSRTMISRTLAKKRDVLVREATETESDLAVLSEDRETELEEQAQVDREAGMLARLDLRERREIAEIDAALARLSVGSYGVCVGCGRGIALQRLRSVPTTRYCRDCAGAHELAAQRTA